MRDVAAWLDELGLGRYCDAFEKNEIRAENLAQLKDGDLKELGLPLGPRRRLLDALKTEAPQETVDERASDRAERRQISVLYCDLVGSTALATRLDPEDLRALMAVYRAAVSQVIERYGGHIAQYLGDGLMTYFGWPRAHEDDPHRAVRAGLEIIEAIRAIDEPEALRVRIGIATGTVVVGAVSGSDATVPKLAVGETPNLAAGMQALAETDELVISQQTRQLVGGAFDCEDLGDHAVGSAASPMRLWRVTGRSGIGGRFTAAHPLPLSKIIGRSAEIALLTDRWDLAVNGEAQLVMVCGEPGIGKSRLVEELHERGADQPCIHIRFQCSPYHTNSPLYPLIRQLERGAGFAADDTESVKLDKLEALLAQGSDDYRHTAAMLSPLLGIDAGDRYPKLGMSPRRQKSEAMDAMADYLAGLSTVNPLLMILEDAHWIDPSSEEAMERVVTRMIGHRALLIVTHRPEYAPPWSNLGHATALGLGHLGRHQVKELALQICGERPLPEAVLRQITTRTDGVPLYVEELTKSVIESNADGSLLPADGGAVPSSLRDSLTARLDRLEYGREVAQIGACIGRTFSHDMLSAVADMPKNTLQESLQELVRSGLLSHAGAPSDQRYRFKHALVQDAAHDLLLKTRRQAIHGRIADILLRDQKEFAEQVPEIIAQHFAEAGNPTKAVKYWLAAGSVASGRFAYAEAVEHLSAGLSHLQHLDEGGTRDRMELGLSLLLGGAYLQVRGFASDQVRDAHTRALSRGESLGDERRTFIALVGLSVWYMVRGPQRRSRELMERLQGVAAEIGDPSLLVVADLLHGILNVFMADNAAARVRLGRVIDMAVSVEPATIIKIVGADPLCQAHLWLSIALWRLGFADQACVHLEKCVGRGDAVDHPASRAGARCMGAVTLLERGELEEAVAMAMAGSTFAKEQSLPDWEAIGLGSCGNAMLRMGKVDEAETVLTIANDMRAVTGNGFHNPELYQGRIRLARGDADAAIAIVDDTLPKIREAGEFWYEVEFLRLKGLALTAKGEDQHEAAEAVFREAIATARTQSAKSFELRAAIDLARLWQAAGREAEAKSLLVPLYAWFTEGYDTADLQHAKRLLGDLKAAH